jgi:hypothetical protein
MRCSRAGDRLALSAVASVTGSVDFSLPKPEKAMAVPVGPRHRLGDLSRRALGELTTLRKSVVGKALPYLLVDCAPNAIGAVFNSPAVGG